MDDHADNQPPIGPKAFFLADDLAHYVSAHSSPPDPVLERLTERTRQMGSVFSMQISPEQGAFMSLLTAAIGARVAVEVGTFTGYSSVCIARGLGPGGRLIACDRSDEWTSVARAAWLDAGVADRIDLRLGPAAETLAALAPDLVVDLAFIDADKENYLVYYEALLAHMRPGGVILADNVLWSGRVVDPDATDADTLALRAFNDAVVNDPRVEVAMLPLADGLSVIRVLP
jgi:caffeoyl-CoA O-methyltransferase